MCNLESTTTFGGEINCHNYLKDIEIIAGNWLYYILHSAIGKISIKCVHQ